MQSPDAAGLDALARSGSDLSKLHHVEFTLHFPTLQDAHDAELKLIGFAFDTDTARNKTGKGWVIRASKTMYPNERDLQGLRDKLEIIAAESHGTYDGWHARVAEPKHP